MRATQGASNRMNGTNNKSDDMIYCMMKVKQGNAERSILKSCMRLTVIGDQSHEFRI